LSEKKVFGKRIPGQFAREAAFFDVEEREEERQRIPKERDNHYSVFKEPEVVSSEQ
jgi:hypothetical protein